MTKDSSIADVVIVGAGMAGATASFVLAKAGVDVMLLDPASTQPPVFKAEKFESDLLRAFNLMDVLLPECRRINRIACGQDGRIWKFKETEEYGCFYHDMVNAVRRALPTSVQIRMARVVGCRTGADIQEVILADGSTVKGRLLVLATGAAAKLYEQLELQRRVWSAGHSVSLGFNFEPTDQLPGRAESITYRERPLESGIDYITLFPIKDVLRANMFTYWDAKDARVQEMRTGGMEALLNLMPRLTDITGPLVLSSNVEAKPVDVYRVEGVLQPGVVLLGDAYQCACPVTGTGLRKVLVDVQTLAELVPYWLQTQGMDASKISQYYAGEKKRVTDENSLIDSLYAKRLCSDRSLAWTARRWKKFFPRWLAGLRHPANNAHKEAKPNGPWTKQTPRLE